MTGFRCAGCGYLYDGLKNKCDSCGSKSLFPNNTRYWEFKSLGIIDTRVGEGK